MFNLQPGQGLGSNPSKLLAFGLGDWIRDLYEEVIYHDKGGAATPADWQEDMRSLILKDDDEILGAIITIVTSGIL